MFNNHRDQSPATNDTPVLFGDAVDVGSEEDPKVDPHLGEKTPNHVELSLGHFSTVNPRKHQLGHSSVEVPQDGVADGRRLGIGQDKFFSFYGHDFPNVGVVILHFFARVGLKQWNTSQRSSMEKVWAEVYPLGDAGTTVLLHFEYAKELEGEPPI